MLNGSVRVGWISSLWMPVWFIACTIIEIDIYFIRGEEMSKVAQGYFVLAIAAVLLFIGSYQATLKIGDAISRMIFWKWNGSVAERFKALLLKSSVG
jgi:riboflavin transporter FmnP